MTWVDSTLSRRTFIFSTATAVASLSTAAALASSIFHRNVEPLHVCIVGFGQHAQRFLDAVEESALCVDAVFDPNVLALMSASELLKQRQPFLPELIKTSSPSLSAQSSSPVLLCSPPHTWAVLIPQLTTHGRPVLAHHTQLFAAPYWPDILHTLVDEGANLLVVGIDPTFPIQSVNSFHAFARSRGALNLSYRLYHPMWANSQLLAFHFDCLTAALPQDIEPGDQEWQFLPMAIERNSSVLPFQASASCSISATGPGIAFGARLRIADDNSIIASSTEYLIQFTKFCRSTQHSRNRVLRRQSALLKLVEASTEAISLFF
jgi:hypothetical protein